MFLFTNLLSNLIPLIIILLYDTSFKVTMSQLFKQSINNMSFLNLSMGLNRVKMWQQLVCFLTR